MYFCTDRVMGDYPAFLQENQNEEFPMKGKFNIWSTILFFSKIFLLAPETTFGQEMLGAAVRNAESKSFIDF